MRKVGRALLYLIGAVVGWSLGAAVGFGVVLSLFWLGNGGRLSPELGGGFELFYSAIAGLAASLPGLFAGAKATAALLSPDPERSGLYQDDPPGV
jgi:hypothetical protein